MVRAWRAVELPADEHTHTHAHTPFCVCVFRLLREAELCSVCVWTHADLMSVKIPKCMKKVHKRKWFCWQKKNNKKKNLRKNPQRSCEIISQFTPTPSMKQVSLTFTQRDDFISALLISPWNHIVTKMSNQECVVNIKFPVWQNTAQGRRLTGNFWIYELYSNSLLLYVFI